MTRVFNDNELGIARKVATARSITLSTALKQLNAQYGVQQWEHIMCLTTKQRAHLNAVVEQRSSTVPAVVSTLSAQYGALWAKKLQNLARRTT